MAEKKTKVEKEPGRIKQLWQVYKLTAKSDKNFVLSGVLAFVGPLAVGVLAIVLFFRDSPLTIFLWSITTLLFSLLSALAILSRRAERAAFMRISGQPGAVAAVMSSTLKRGYSTSDMPVAVDPKSRDAVYRAVGKAGVVLVAEGSSARVKQLIEDEKRKVSRAIPGVTIPVVWVNSDPASTQLHALTKTIYKLKRTLNRAEISVVNKRLGGLGLNIPIPKGIDPNRMRPGRRM
ncbi:unannotated protein [freshwater metagenome]|uniref:Unannotated protein n=1 Tax=freshwater metagenome TaxID=449393 RepID=A0A6J6IV09_9ZZZZ|nr:DUF4191 family protein [Actinomycetota bacterium]